MGGKSIFKIQKIIYFTLDLTELTNVLAGLKAGMKFSGIIIVVFFEIFLPVFFLNS